MSCEPFRNPDSRGPTPEIREIHPKIVILMKGIIRVEKIPKVRVLMRLKKCFVVKVSLFVNIFSNIKCRSHFDT